MNYFIVIYNKEQGDFVEKKNVLLMYSGGLDSILSMVRLISNGYKVLLVHFDNGCSISIGLEVERAKYFERKYGKDTVEYIGKITTVPEFRNNEIELANMPFSEIQANYGDCTISQIRCLNCRSAMYFEAITYCLNNNISYIAEGARKSQLFSIEQPAMIESYKELLEKFGIELLLPVYDLENDWDKENELLLHGILPCASEDKCVLGMPITNPISEEQTNAVKTIFEKIIEPRYAKTLKKVQKQTIYRGHDRVKFQ